MNENNPMEQDYAMRRVQESQTSISEAVLPIPYKDFVRDPEVVVQTTFSQDVKDVVLVPIRAELSNNNLASFLKQLSTQKGFNQDKLGVVFLINDKQVDAQKEDVYSQNTETMHFLSLLASGNIEAINGLSINQEYKDIAQDIIAKNILEIKSDYVHYTHRRTHFGLLRAHLLKLAEALKNPATSDSEMILHLSDMDTGFSTSHFQTLKDFYMDPSNVLNFSEQDYLPGVHEGATDRDISKDLLSNFDVYRLYQYSADLTSFINGHFASGTPTISGRLSYFFNPELFKKIEERNTGEDFSVGRFARKNQPEQFGKTIGNNGEVFRINRARTLSKGQGAVTDAEQTYKIVTEGEFKIDDISLKTQGDEFIEKIEKEILIPEDVPGSVENTRLPRSEYQILLQKELDVEAVKVRLRRKRLFQYISSVSANKELPKGTVERSIVDPFIQYFQEDRDDIQQQVNIGKEPVQIAVSLLQKYPDFFSSDTAIHTQVAKIRALRKYAFAHNIDPYSKAA